MDTGIAIVARIGVLTVVVWIAVGNYIVPIMVWIDGITIVVPTTTTTLY